MREACLVAAPHEPSLQPSAKLCCRCNKVLHRWFMSAMQDADVVEATHEPPLVCSPGFSRLGGAQPAKAGTTNPVPGRFIATTHVRIGEVFPFHEPERRPPARRGGSPLRTRCRAGGRLPLWGRACPGKSGVAAALCHRSPKRLSSPSGLRELAASPRTSGCAGVLRCLPKLPVKWPMQRRSARAPASWTAAAGCRFWHARNAAASSRSPRRSRAIPAPDR